MTNPAVVGPAWTELALVERARGPRTWTIARRHVTELRLGHPGVCAVSR